MRQASMGVAIDQNASQQSGPGRQARGKVFPSPGAAVADVFDGAVVLIAGFAGCGWPESLLRALNNGEATGLTVVCQGAWLSLPTTGSGPPAAFAGAVQGVDEIEKLLAGGRVRKLVSPLAFCPGHGGPVEERWKTGDLEIEPVPQGVLAERLRAGGAGLGGVFMPTGAGTRFVRGRETHRFGGRDHVFEPALRADFALLRARDADTLGNLVYRGTQRNWNPVMAMAAKVTIAEVDQVLEPGGLDPEAVITPGIFVNRIVQTV